MSKRGKRRLRYHESEEKEVGKWIVTKTYSEASARRSPFTIVLRTHGTLPCTRKEEARHGKSYLLGYTIFFHPTGRMIVNEEMTFRSPERRRRSMDLLLSDPDTWFSGQPEYESRMMEALL